MKEIMFNFHSFTQLEERKLENHLLSHIIIVLNDSIFVNLKSSIHAYLLYMDKHLNYKKIN